MRPSVEYPDPSPQPANSQGIPDAWFKVWVDTAQRIPQGFPALDFALAPLYFKSLASRELTWKQASDSMVNDSQAKEFARRGNENHDRLGVEFRVQAVFAKYRWFREKALFRDLRREFTKWVDQDIETDGFPLIGPLPKEDKIDPKNWTDSTSELDRLSRAPSFIRKLGILVDLTQSGAGAFNLPSSQAAIDRHLLLAETDLAYREDIGMQQALDPLYENITRQVQKRSAEITEQHGLVIPTAILDWWK